MYLLIFASGKSALDVIRRVGLVNSVWSCDRENYPVRYGIALCWPLCMAEVDECRRTFGDGESGPCNDNAECVNTAGSYRCVCRDGYSVDGLTCTRTLHELRTGKPPPKSFSFSFSLKVVLFECRREERSRRRLNTRTSFRFRHWKFSSSEISHCSFWVQPLLSTMSTRRYLGYLKMFVLWRSLSRAPVSIIIILIRMPFLTVDATEDALPVATHASTIWFL